MAPYYRPGPNEDPKAWEEALTNKPGPGYIPVLCVGFAQMGERIKLQQRNLSNFNVRLHEINSSLTKMMQEHETKTSIRTIDARRKHVVLKQRCLALATKVQVLRNRGYAMAGDEEDLRTKLLALEKNVTDPGLGARGEEIWARMLIVQDRARTLRNEIEKSGTEAPDVLDEETSRQAKKVCFLILPDKPFLTFSRYWRITIPNYPILKESMSRSTKSFWNGERSKEVSRHQMPRRR